MLSKDFAGYRADVPTIESGRAKDTPTLHPYKFISFCGGVLETSVEKTVKVSASFSTLSLFICFCGVVVFSGCGLKIPERPIQITISRSQIFRPQRPEEVKNEAQAIQAIVTACKDSLNLPIVDPLELKLYKNATSMAFYGRGWRTLAIDVKNEIAFTQGNTIHINLEALPKRPFGLVKLLAHEYAHAIENSISGNKSNTPTWFSEGFAEWFAARILNSLSWQNYHTVVTGAREELFVYQNIIPRIDSLILDKDWQFFLKGSKGFISTYKLAFVAVDNLVTTKGMSAVIAYAGSGDFKNSFGLSMQGFASDLAKYIRQTRQAQLKELIATKPTWSEGDKWTYVETRPRRTSRITKQIIREEELDGMPAFVVATSNGEILYSKETLGAVGIMKNGKLIFTTDKPEQDLLWPLESGKSWQNSFSVKNVSNNSITKVDRSMLITGNEKITVPAGTFDAVKIEAFESKSGDLLGEYWYSPRVKWLVKSRRYSNEDGIVEEELSDFQVK